jgi:hypothetical protein
MRCPALLILGLALVACRESPAAPEGVRVSLAMLGEPIVYAPADAALGEPIQVAAVDAATGSPARGVLISWQAIQGSIGVTPETSSTDSWGVASTSLGPASIGTYRVRASAPRMAGAAPSVEVRVVPRPAIAAVQPATVSAGAEVTITGSNFSQDADQNTVRFDGVRGRVVAASATQLRVTVPQCLPSRDAAVTVALGSVVSAPHAVATTGAAVPLVSLVPGEVRLISQPAELDCIRLPGAQNGAAYVLAVHSTASILAPSTPFELRSLTPRPLAAITIMTAAPAAPSFAAEWEARLRLSERALGTPAPGEGPPQLRYATVPALGSQRDFSVLDPDNRFVKVTAEVRHLSARAIIYVDVEAEGVFTEADLRSIGEVFDDPIHPTNVSVFGGPSDIDANERVIILFTPRVNALTPRSQSSFIAGYFYGCDLVSRNRCSGSNLGEIFYSMVPDPTGKWSDARARATVLAAVPPVLAHEFQHMIHFARRGFSADALWLSEALAHTAEELVADVFAGRGDLTTAAQFRNGNYQRAQSYLQSPSATSMLAEELPGTLELRGVGWLFLKHLRGHYGGNDLLGRLTASSRTSAANITHETGQAWSTLVTDFGVALHADGSPDIQGPVAPRFGFQGFNLRSALAPLPGGFPLRPATLGWGDVALSASVASAAHAYYSFTAPAAGTPPELTLVVSGVRGAGFTQASNVTVSVLRVR